MSTPNEPCQWLPADERLANAICHGASVFVKNAEGDTGTIDKAVVKELCGCPNLTVTDALQTLVQNKIQYLPPTAPEVLELPDCEGSWWWTWSKLSAYGPRWLCFEYPNPKLSSKGYYVNAALYPKPSFNPTTGEKL